MKTLRLVAVILLSLTILVAFGEWSVRRAGLVDRLNAYPRQLYMATSHPDLPYRLRPGFERGSRGAKHGVRVNRHGLRGAEIEDVPAPGRRRILVLGDSVVQGHSLAEADSFPVRLAEELEKRRISRAEVLNGGTAGWNTLAEAAFLEEFGLALKPHAVLLGVSLNDYGDTPVLTERGVLTQDREDRFWPSWLTDHSELYLVLRFFVHSVLRRPPSDDEQLLGGDTREENAGARQTPSASPSRQGPKRKSRSVTMGAWVERLHRRFYAAPSEAEWQRVREGLARIAALTKERGIDLVVMIFPEGFQFDAKRPYRGPQRAWLELCGELELECIDLWPAFAAGSDDPGETLFADVQHPNPTGHIVAARAVADRLLKRWRDGEGAERSDRAPPRRT